MGKGFLILEGLFVLFTISFVSAEILPSEGYNAFDNISSKFYNQQYFEDCWNNLNPSCYILGTFGGRPRTPNVPITSAGKTSGCTDTDGGWNLFDSGQIEVKGYYSDGSSGIFSDRCNGKVLTEYFCSSTSTFRYDLGRIDYSCNVGCLRNECIPLKCTDTDGGFNPNVRGKITTQNSPAENGLEDFCTGEIVTEYFCGEDRVVKKEQGCIKGCDEGACNPYEIGGGGGPIPDPKNPDPEPCRTCEFGEKCYPFGARIKSEGQRYYCDVDKFMKPQKSIDSTGCIEDYECEDNICSEGKCLDLDVFLDEVNFFVEAWYKTSCRLYVIANPLESYEQCIVDKFEGYFD